MRRFADILICLALLSGCGADNVRTFWNTHSIDYSNVDAARDQFARYAEKAVAGDEADAVASLDILFDKLKEDEVAYYLYSDWIDGVFYNPLSPCRSSALYSRAVERLTGDGILPASDLEPFIQKREWMLLNREGSKAVVPGVGAIDTRTVVLVLDLGCPSCREALDKLSEDPQWSEVRRIAIGCGFGPKPDAPGWEYFYPSNATAVFDPHYTPVYFVVSEDGIVESSYKLAL